MITTNLLTRIRTGRTYLADHPQLWSTALVGFAIFLAFVGTSYRFASIAQDAQEKLANVRVGSLLDSFVLFAPVVLENPVFLREQIHTLRVQNPTIESFRILAPHGVREWRVYITDDGSDEGRVEQAVAPLYGLAVESPHEAFTMATDVDGVRYFMTARAIAPEGGEVSALVVTTQRLAEADRAIAASIRMSFYGLALVLVLVMVLFFRHARILDYATLYRKQREIDETKDSFISMASHELKSPLTVIRGYVEFLKEGAGNPEERAEFLRRIDVSTQELTQLIDDILDVSRIQMGRLRFVHTDVDPHVLLDEVATMFLAQAEKKGLTISVVPTPGTLSIDADRGRLKQVLVNLVSNAVKYSLAGTITLATADEGGRVAISVRDNGIGLTSEEQKRLFGKFYRAEAAEAKGVSGTGLGLWITKYIVENMNGTIAVESIKGEGSRFSVTFPKRVRV